MSGVVVRVTWHVVRAPNNDACSPSRLSTLYYCLGSLSQGRGALKYRSLRKVNSGDFASSMEMLELVAGNSSFRCE